MAPPPPASTGTATVSPPTVRTGWIDGAGRDLAFYIATPLLLIPLILLQRGRPAIEDLLIYVGGFGALGHHLPGMMRAYGDRALFRRFRARFILAPLVLVPLCVFFSVRELSGIVLVAFFWTHWHLLMQVFGFARIYDVKVGSTSAWTARLDHALCVVWIGAPLLLSDSKFGSFLDTWYRTGAPLISTGFADVLRTGWTAAVVGVSVVWLAHTALAWSRGNAPNVAKLALFVSSFGFWWFCTASVGNLLVGIALFDIFHDVQYLALVWTFNKARVASDKGVGGFSRFLFRGRMTLVGVYVGLVVAYGSIGFFSESITDDMIRQPLLGVLAASALLHFYFDGFIWKVREQSTRSGLSAGGGGDDIRLGGLVPGWAVHGGKWLFLLVPVGAFYAWETNDSRGERERREAIVATVPASAEALTSLAAVMDPRSEGDEALDMHRRAIEMKPSYPVAHNNLGAALLLLGRTDEAKAAFLEAIRLFPGYAAAHRHLGSILVGSGEPESAAEHFRAAIEHDPRDAPAYAGLGMLTSSRGDAREAIELFEQALELKDTERTALNGLAWLLATHADADVRDGARAVTYAEKLVGLAERNEPMTLNTLAAAYAEAGRFDDAIRTIKEAIELARRRGDHGMTAALERHRQQFEAGLTLRRAE